MPDRVINIKLVIQNARGGSRRKQRSAHTTNHIQELHEHSTAEKSECNSSGGRRVLFFLQVLDFLFRRRRPDLDTNLPLVGDHVKGGELVVEAFDLVLAFIQPGGRKCLVIVGDHHVSRVEESRSHVCGRRRRVDPEARPGRHGDDDVALGHMQGRVITQVV